MNDFIGKTIAGYQITSEIGRGSLATVYRAEGQGQVVALKIVPLGELAAASALAEQMAPVAALRHPRILELYEYGTEDGFAYLVTQLIEGGSNLAHILQGGAMSRWKALEMIRQVAAALETAHAASVLHLDLKPSNVLLNDKNWPWVADFGLAAALRGAGGQLPDTGYLAPEQAQGGPVDQRTDIYALGLLLYEMLTGARPAAAAGLPASPHMLNTRVSESLSHVTLRALAPSPADRYGSVTEFTQALKSAAGDSNYREPIVEMLAAMPAAGALAAAAAHTPTGEGIEPGEAVAPEGIEPGEVIAPEGIEPGEAIAPEGIEPDEAIAPEGIEPEEAIAPEGIEPEEAVAPEDIEPVLPEQPLHEEPGVLIRLPKATGSVAKTAPPDADELPVGFGDGPDVEAAAVAAAAVAIGAAGEAEAATEPVEPPALSQPEPEPGPSAEAVPAAPKTMPRPEVIMTSGPPKVTPAPVKPTPPTARKGSAAPEWKLPVWVTVLGLLLVAVIAVWVIFAMSFSDTGARLSATQTAAALAAIEPTATQTPLPTNTLAPLPTDTPEPVVVTDTPTTEPAVTDTPTPEAVPTDTPTPEAAPTDTPAAPEATPTDTPEPTATPPAGTWTLLSPAPGDPAVAGPEPFNFQWQWSEPLQPGQGFEIRVWRSGQGPQGAHDAVADNAAGLIRQLDETTYAFDLDISNAANVQNVTSEYQWTVALVQLSPYADLGQQSQPGSLQYIGTRGPDDAGAQQAPPEAPAEEVPPADPAAPETPPDSGSGG